MITSRRSMASPRLAQRPGFSCDHHASRPAVHGVGDKAVVHPFSVRVQLTFNVGCTLETRLRNPGDNSRIPHWKTSGVSLPRQKRTTGCEPKARSRQRGRDPRARSVKAARRGLATPVGRCRTGPAGSRRWPGRASGVRTPRGTGRGARATPPEPWGRRTVTGLTTPPA